MADSGGTDWQGIAAAADAGGGVFTSAFNVHEVRQNRRFAREMANTPHQREVADLRLAGLNPVLSANGNGSPVPSVQAPEMSNPLEGYSAKAISALQASNLQAQTANVNADTEGKIVQNRLNQEDMQNELLRRRAVYTLMLKEGNVKDATRANIEKQISKLDSEIFLLDQQKPEYSAKSSYYKGPGKAFPFVGQDAYGPGALLHSGKSIYDWLNKEYPNK